MKNFYYSMRFYIEKYPLEINCSNIINMIDNISVLLGCEYHELGYTLLHPDYNYKELGKIFCKSKKSKELFKGLDIPIRYYGNKTEIPATPMLVFQSKVNSSWLFPLFSIEINYPPIESQYLSIVLDISKDMLKQKITLSIFRDIQTIIETNGYCINSGFVHYYYGNARRIILDGGESGIITANDWRIINHAIGYVEDWKNKVLDIFYINSIRCEALPRSTMEEIKKIVGECNFIEENDKCIFKLPQSLNMYLLNHLVSTSSRRQIKYILQKENICEKDSSLIATVLRL